MDLSRYKLKIFQFIISLFTTIPIFLNTPIQSYASETGSATATVSGNIGSVISSGTTVPDAE